MVLISDLDYYVNLPATQYSDRAKRLEYRIEPGLIGGINRNVSTAGNEDVWDGPTGLWVPPTAARIHDIVSDNVADTLAGTGARKVQILGLDSALEDISEVVEMDGTTIVPTVNSYLRINDIFVIEAGTDGTNQGIIEATAQTDGTVTVHMPAEKSESQATIFTVGANRLLLLTSIDIQMFLAMGSPNADVSTAIRTRSPVDEATAALRTSIPIRLNRDTLPRFAIEFNVFLKIPEKTDIIGHVETSSSNNVELAMAIGFLLIDVS